MVYDLFEKKNGQDGVQVYFPQAISKTCRERGQVAPMLLELGVYFYNLRANIMKTMSSERLRTIF